MCVPKRKLFGQCTTNAHKETFSVEYYLTSSVEEDIVRYGIELVKKPQQEVCRISDVSTNIGEVVLLLKLLLDGQVTPVTAHDVVSDFLIAREEVFFT